MSLTAHAFITTQGLQARLKRAEGSAEADVEQRLIDAVNAATGYWERVTRRRLAARNHRTAVAITCSGSSGDETLTGSTFTTQLEAGDEVVGSASLPGGALVASITSAAELELNRKLVASLSSVSLTFGSEPLIVSGDGTNVAWCPEFPLVELFAAYSRNSDGTREAIDITNAVLERSTGRIELVGDIFPAGSMNIDLEARAGYEQPSATRRGDQDWFDLEALAYRVGEIFFLDALNLRGRTEDVSVGSLSARYGISDMPADVQAGIHRYLRRFS